MSAARQSLTLVFCFTLQFDSRVWELLSHECTQLHPHHAAESKHETVTAFLHLLSGKHKSSFSFLDRGVREKGSIVLTVNTASLKAPHSPDYR